MEIFMYFFIILIQENILSDSKLCMYVSKIFREINVI